MIPVKNASRMMAYRATHRRWLSQNGITEGGWQQASRIRIRIRSQSFDLIGVLSLGQDF